MIEYQITGTVVTSVPTPNGLFVTSPTFSGLLGESFSFTAVLDDTSGFLDLNAQLYDGSLGFDVGGFSGTATSGSLDPHDGIGAVQNDVLVGGLPHDVFVIQRNTSSSTFVNSSGLGAFNLGTVNLVLHDTTGTALGNLLLPTSVSLSDFTHSYLRLLLSNDSGLHAILADVDSISVASVPEPSSLLLMTMVGGAAAATRRRRLLCARRRIARRPGHTSVTSAS
jgi:hypothetical protein